MSTDTVSPLRQRMMDDMNARKPIAVAAARAGRAQAGQHHRLTRAGAAGRRAYRTRPCRGS